MTSPTGGPATGPLLTALRDLRRAVRHAPLREDLPTATQAEHLRQEILATLHDQVLPRLTSPGAPVLVVVAGPTGAGKSTLVNSLVRAPVCATGVVRPTTRAPVLVCNPADASWYLDGSTLSGLRPVREVTDDQHTVQVVPSESVPRGVAVLDAPDVDSVAADDRELATRLLSAADVWLFVLTANRYADAVPWQHLVAARDRGAVLVLVLDRVPPAAAGEVRAHLGEMLTYAGLGQTPVFTVHETALTAGLLGEFDVVTLRDWLQRVAADPVVREAIVGRAYSGALRVLPGRARAFAGLVGQHHGAMSALEQDLETAFDDACRVLADGFESGVVVTGELLRQWEHYVDGGGLMPLLSPARKGLFRRRPNAPGAAELGDALEDALAAHVQVLAARALAALRAAWADRPGGAEVAGWVDWSPRTDLAGATVEVLRGWAGAGGPVLSLLAVGAAASSELVGDERVRAVADDPTHAQRVQVLRMDLVARLGDVLRAERDALAAEAGLGAFVGADEAVRAAADAVEQALA